MDTIEEVVRAVHVALTDGRACGAGGGLTVHPTEAPLSDCDGCLADVGITFANGGRCKALMPDGTACEGILWRVDATEDSVMYACASGHGWVWNAPWGAQAASSYRDDSIARVAFGADVLAGVA